MISFADFNEEFCTENDGFLDLSNNNLKLSLDGNITKVRLIFFGANQSALIETVQDAFESFPNLKVLDLQHNNIDDLTAISFEGANSLEELLLGYNKITILQDNVFSEAKKLKKLCVANNAIHKIEKHAFDDLTYLEMLHLEHNKLVSIEPETFVMLPELTHLRLQNNPIIDLKESLFDHNVKLKELAFNDYSIIQRIDYNVLMILKNDDGSLSDKLTNYPITQLNNEKNQLQEELKNLESHNALQANRSIEKELQIKSLNEEILNKTNLCMEDINSKDDEIKSLKYNNTEISNLLKEQYEAMALKDDKSTENENLKKELENNLKTTNLYIEELNSKDDEIQSLKYNNTEISNLLKEQYKAMALKDEKSAENENLKKELDATKKTRNILWGATTCCVFVALVAGVILAMNYRSKTSKVLEMYSASKAIEIEDKYDSDIQMRGMNDDNDS